MDEKTLGKRWKHESGDIYVRIAKDQGRCGVVEIMHLTSGESGYVVGAYEVRKVDGEPYPEFKVVHDRLTNLPEDLPIMEILKYGQKLAEIAVESGLK